MKRNLIIILVVILTAVAASIWFSKEESVFVKEGSLYKAVPTSSPVFVEFNSLQSIPKANPILQELSAISDFKSFLEQIEKIESLIKGNKNIQNHFAKKPVILSLDFIGKNILKPVIIGDLQSSEELKGFEILMEKLMGVPASSFQYRKYDGHRIVDIADAEGEKVIHYCAVGGLVIISPEAILVEKCIRQLSTQNITTISSFSKVNKTAGRQNGGSWYINHNKFPELCANFLNPQTNQVTNEFGEILKTNLRREVLGIRNYASWSELDMSFDANQLLLNGITVANDSLNHFLSVFEGQVPVNCQADRLLPKNTSFFIEFAFSDSELFFNRLESYFEHSNDYYKREERIKKIEDYCRSGIRNTLKSLVKSQVVAAMTTLPTQNDSETTLFIVNNPSRNENRELFEGLLQNYASRKKIEFNNLISEFETNKGKSYRIYSFPYPSLPGIWLGKAFRFVQANYAVFYDDNLVFASSKEALQKYLTDMETGTTLKSDQNYARYKQSIESKANLNTFVNVNRCLSLNETLFSSQIVKGIEANENTFRKFDFLSWQVVCENNIYFNSVNLGFNKEPQADARAFWQSNLGAPISSKPQIVVNHLDKAEKEIIVQDDNNTLHLLAASGKIIWSIPVKGKILGEIHQIDYYRNGKLQYLFNTKEKLYLIDRNGDKVANFPLIFKAPATNGVSVFDYDNNRKYRYFVACENRKVYAYSHEGNIISGWKFGQTSSAVTSCIQHFRVNGRDYIVFKDNSKVYILNRQGETRVASTAKFEPSINPLFLITTGTPKIVTSDKTGKVFYLFFDGKYAEKKTARLSENHRFTVEDIDGNGVVDFVFIDGNELKVIDEKGEELFSERFDDSLSGSVNLYTFSSKRKEIGVTDSENNRIYLFDSRGELHSGFPLSGNTEFSIGDLSGQQLNLVVGSADGGLLNYILE